MTYCKKIFLLLPDSQNNSVLESKCVLTFIKPTNEVREFRSPVNEMYIVVKK